MFKRSRTRFGGIPPINFDVEEDRRHAAIWALRLFLGREPDSETEIALHATHQSLASIRTAFAQTAEFRAFLQQIDGEADYRVPLFLLEPPTEAHIPWRFEPPTLEKPTTQLCTAAQFDELEFSRWCRELNMVPHRHRKAWEFCYILAVLNSAGALKAGARALGFGVGREAMPAVLARMGLTVVATDVPSDNAEFAKWAASDQHADTLLALEHPEILPHEKLRKQVTFRPVDMNAIPEDLRDFDICWSACALEHLGSLEHGLNFVESSLATLKPGGIAVHTTEFNISSNEGTVESQSLSLYRKRDIVRLFEKLTSHGHAVFPLNLYPGSSPVDQYVDLPPYHQDPHLKLKLLEFVTTSIGLAVQKAKQ